MKTEQKWKICDCLEGLPEIPDKSIDMILTDLPYGITECSWDNTLKLDCLWAEYRRIVKNKGVIVLTASQPFTSILVMSAPDLFKYEWIWQKQKGTNYANANKIPMKVHENVLVFYLNLPTYNPQKTNERKYYRKGGVRNSPTKILGSKSPAGHYLTDGFRTGRFPITVQYFSNEGMNNGNYHATQKPLALFEYLIKTYTNEGDMVHDSCLGSGTTLEACMNLNRNCIGFEIDPQWEPIYRKRLRLDNTKLDAYDTSACPEPQSIYNKNPK